MTATLLYNRLGLDTGVQPLGTGMAVPFGNETALLATRLLRVSSSYLLYSC